MTCFNSGGANIVGGPANTRADMRKRSDTVMAERWRNKIYDVVGIGNAIVDIIARCDDAFLSKHDLAKGFMRLIDAGEAGAPL